MMNLHTFVYIYAHPNKQACLQLHTNPNMHWWSRNTYIYKMKRKTAALKMKIFHLLLWANSFSFLCTRYCVCVRIAICYKVSCRDSFRMYSHVFCCAVVVVFVMLWCCLLCFVVICYFWCRFLLFRRVIYSFFQIIYCYFVLLCCGISCDYFLFF